MGFFDFFSSRKNRDALVKGMERTREGVFSKIARLITRKARVDDDMLDELE